MFAAKVCVCLFASALLSLSLSGCKEKQNPLKPTVAASTTH